MTRVSGIRTKETVDHYVWHEVCDGWTLLGSSDLHVVLEQMPSGASEVRHRHAHTRQLYFVIKGEGVVEVGNDTTAVPVGAGVAIEPGITHQIRNEGGAVLEFLVISSSPPRDDREEIPSIGR